MTSPERFRVEVLFSSGAYHNPYDNGEKAGHFLPVSIRSPLHRGGRGPSILCAVCCCHHEDLCQPLSGSRPFGCAAGWSAGRLYMYLKSRRLLKALYNLFGHQHLH